MGMKLHGGIVSQDKVFIEGFSMKITVRVVEFTYLLPQLRDSQS